MAESAAFAHARGRASGSTFAAIDLGTNNCRLLVGTPAGRGFAELDRFSRIVRLGEGLEKTGRLAPRAMDRTLAALATCAERIAHWRPARLSAIATEACRRATNGAEFLGRVLCETGIPITIVSAREETELAVEGCASLLTRAGSVRAERRALLFDIGGGSTELAWLRLDRSGHPRVMGATSLAVGVVTLAERYGAEAFTATGFAAMTEDAARLLAPFEAVHCIAHEIRQCERHDAASRSVRLLGTSGTATTLAAIALALPYYSRRLVDGTVLAREASDQALAALLALGRAGLMRHPCIGPERAPFVLPGAAIFAALRQTWPASHMIVADRGLREGILLRLIRASHRADLPPRRVNGDA